MSARPKYDDLPDGYATGIFGRDGQLGCLNLLTPERVVAAAGLILGEQRLEFLLGLDSRSTSWAYRTKRSRFAKISAA
jgi:hypothetical protein